MKILDLYIARVILSTSALCLIMLVGLSGVIKWVDQLRLVGRGTYSMLDAGIYVLYLIPRDLEMFFPMGVLLGALIGMGTLASNSELVIMQNSGLSRFQITVSAMKTALPLMILVMAIGEWGAPITEQKANDLKATEISGGSLIQSYRGIWAKDGDMFVNIGQLVSADELRNVTLYQFDSQLKLTSIIQGESAKFASGSWLLSTVTHTNLNYSGVKVHKLKEYKWHSSLTPDKLSVVSARPESLSIEGLVGYLEYLHENNQDTSRYELALWRKILQPVTVAVMLLVALSFVFGPLRSVTMGARVLLGMTAGFSFYISNEIFGPVSLVYDLPAYVGAAMPSILFTAMAWYFIRR